MNVLKKFIRSRKFWLTVIGILTVVLQEVIGLSAEIVSQVTNMIMVLVGAIGVADLGEGAVHAFEKTKEK